MSLLTNPRIRDAIVDASTLHVDRLITDVMDRLSQVQITNGFATDLGSDVSIYECIPEWKFRDGSNQGNNIPAVSYLTVKGDLRRIVIPLLIEVPIQGCEQTTLDNVWEDIKRALNFSSRTYRKDYILGVVESISNGFVIIVNLSLQLEMLASKRNANKRLKNDLYK